MKTVYLDNGATTIPDASVLSLVQKISSQEYGNASSIHHMGVQARAVLEDARKKIASSIDATPDELLFTSGGSESNNLAIKGFAFANKNKGNHIIITKIEHECVLNSCKWLQTQGFEITFLDVDKEGFVSAKSLEDAITPKTILVSIIHANNEIGTIQDIPALYSICKKHKVILHTDACQSYTKTAVSSNFADMITLNSHKIHGPKGVGALYVRKGIKLTALIHGGGHERNLRSGTENVAGIVGFAYASELAFEKKHVQKMQSLRDYFINEALKIDATQLNGATGKNRLCNNVNISFRGIEGESIIAMLDLDGICASTGSACASKSLDPSHVLMALEDDAERAHGSVRFSLSRYTTKEEIDFALEKLKSTVQRLRKISPISRE
ncbi:MAG: cysteine desulfurase family protein [Candidatus Micrarchaeia archaeon]